MDLLVPSLVTVMRFWAEGIRGGNFSPADLPSAAKLQALPPWIAAWNSLTEGRSRCARYGVVVGKITARLAAWLDGDYRDDYPLAKPASALSCTMGAFAMRTPRQMPPKARAIELSPRDQVPNKIVVVGGAPPLEEHLCKLCGSLINAAVARYVNWTTGEHWHLACGA
jgi:hypothetical protein